jgi:predicted nucleotide-binding protein (sugar kinase/HSP70/actin superfamily)
MFLCGQGDMQHGPGAGDGLEFDVPFSLGFVWAIVLSDIVQDFEYQTRPFEVTPGETARVARESVEYLYEVFRRMPDRGKTWGAITWHLTTRYFTNALREVRRRFDRVEVDRLRLKPVVKLTGEFYVQTVEGAPNYHIHRWLETEGAEVYPAAVSIWIDYLLRFARQDAEDHVGLHRYARLKVAGLRLGQGALRWTYQRMRRAMGGVPHTLPDQYELRRLAAPYFHSRLSGGEGDMLIGKALWAHQQPTYTPVQQIVESSGTLFFLFQDLDSTKPAGSVKIRVETIAHYLERCSADIIAKKRTASPQECPL